MLVVIDVRSSFSFVLRVGPWYRNILLNRSKAFTISAPVTPFARRFDPESKAGKKRSSFAAL